MERRLNCWEYKKCGYGPNVKKSGHMICPTVSEGRLNGVHNGAQGWKGLLGHSRYILQW